MNQDPNDLTPPPKLRLVNDDEAHPELLALARQAGELHVIEEILPPQFTFPKPDAACQKAHELRKVLMDPNHHARRKAQPITRGALDYFPDALLAVSELSRIANEQHNPGEPMHWAKEKSTDHADCLVRHLLERGQIDQTTGLSHTVAVAWRALALLQTEIEAARKAGE